MKASSVVEGLNKLYPHPKSDLNFTHDYELVLSVMLSAQTTDKQVNTVTSSLYKTYNSLEKLDKLTIDETEKLLSRIGLYRNKSRYFKKIVSELIKYNKVPNDRKLLESLPGIGRKSANVILSVLYEEPYIAVDTHVIRLSKRFGISDSDDVLKIENKFYDYFKGFDYKKLGLQLVLFGRYVCTSKKPCCESCPLYRECNAKDKKI